MKREVTEAHYLHERSGLELVLRPPVKQPTALAWVPRKEELVAATRDGELIHVDPVLGTRIIADNMGETAVLDLHPDRKRFLLITREGRWRVGQLGDGSIDYEGTHGFLGGVMGFFLGEYVILCGDEDRERYLYIYRGTERRGRVRLPHRVVPLKSPNGRLLLARSTPAGLITIPFPSGRFPKDLESTIHRLRGSHEFILGFTTTGICVWGQQGGQSRSMRLPELTAGDIRHDGKYLGLGTRNGAVALARMDRVEKRVHPDLVRAFQNPVTTVSFSTRGRWLATGAEGLFIWSWED